MIGKLAIERIALAGSIDAILIDETIVIDTQVSQPAYVPLLTHELVHADTNPFNLYTAPKSTQSKYEAIAVRETARWLVPLDRLIALYFDGAQSSEEFAEALEVDVAYFERTIWLYHETYGYAYRYRNHVINFMPFWIRRVEQA